MIYRLLLPFLILLVVIISNSCEGVSTSNSKSEEYLNYDTTGYINKYMDADFNEVHYKSKASYYRHAFYVNGVICPDSLVKDYYKTGELLFEGYIKSENPDVIKGIGTWYYKNGKKEETYATDDKGEIHGQYLCYHENGRQFKIYHYNHGELHGECTRFYSNGNKEFVYHYKNGKKHGSAIDYYSNGKIKATYSYIDGLQNGVCKQYYESGNLESVAHCINDSYEGVIRIYHENGNLKEYRTYKNNDCNGEYRTYYPNGKLESKGMALNGYQVGIWEYYDVNGFVSYTNHSASTPTYTTGGSRHRSNYAALWAECEDLESALEDAGIDHESLSYPMDYYDLLNLRDEYQSLLEENDIDY